VPQSVYVLFLTTSATPTVPNADEV
jgi:hypothetical protein